MSALPTTVPKTLVIEEKPSITLPLSKDKKSKSSNALDRFPIEEDPISRLTLAKALSTSRGLSSHIPSPKANRSRSVDATNNSPLKTLSMRLPSFSIRMTPRKATDETSDRPVSMMFPFGGVFNTNTTNNSITKETRPISLHIPFGKNKHRSNSLTSESSTVPHPMLIAAKEEITEVNKEDAEVKQKKYLEVLSNNLNSKAPSVAGSEGSKDEENTKKLNRVEEVPLDEILGKLTAEKPISSSVKVVSSDPNNSAGRPSSMRIPFFSSPVKTSEASKSNSNSSVEVPHRPMSVRFPFGRHKRMADEAVPGTDPTASKDVSHTASSFRPLSLRFPFSSKPSSPAVAGSSSDRPMSMRFLFSGSNASKTTGSASPSTETGSSRPMSMRVASGGARGGLATDGVSIVASSVEDNVSDHSNSDEEADPKPNPNRFSLTSAMRNIIPTLGRQKSKPKYGVFVDSLKPIADDDEHEEFSGPVEVPVKGVDEDDVDGEAELSLQINNTESWSFTDKTTPRILSIKKVKTSPLADRPLPTLPGEVYIEEKHQDNESNENLDEIIPPVITANSSREVLLELYNSTDRDKWSRQTNWDSVKPLNQWFGVVTNREGSIAQLILPGNNLNGTIPYSLGCYHVKFIQVLNLSENKLSGSIPSSVGDLLHLTELILHSNELSGKIPTSLGSLSNLRVLSLHSNALIGSVPNSFSSLVELEELDLSFNQLNGTFPEVLTRLKKLKRLMIANNQYSGSIPELISELTELSHLDLSLNRISGTIPISIGGLSKLNELYLWGNKLSGALPSSIGDLTALVNMSLCNNKLTGVVPESISALVDLKQLDLSNNQLVLSVDAVKWNNMTALELINLRLNKTSVVRAKLMEHVPGCQNVIV